MAEDAVDIRAMFKAKMGFSADDVPMDDEQLENFLMLCHQAILGITNGEEDEMDIKVIKVHDGNIHGMMNKLLGPGGM